MEQLNCDSCGKPRAVWYRHGIDAPPNEYYTERDSLMRYLGKDPDMKPEPMEVIDFLSMQETIDNQADTISELEDAVSDLTATIALMEAEATKMVDAFEELKDILENMYREIAKVI